MGRASRVLGVVLGVLQSLAIAFVALAGLCALVGALVAYFRGGTSYANAIAWAMWIGGSLAVLLVGQAGSPSRAAARSRIVVGGRFAGGSDIPQPQSPFVLIPAGFLTIAVGVLLSLYG